MWLEIRREERAARRFCSMDQREGFGVVLVHSYLANPEQVRQLAAYLSGRGIWVYAPRLAGHGTTPEDLAERTYDEWLEAVETGYAIISNICEKVILGGMAVGGCLAFDLAARIKGTRRCLCCLPSVFIA